MELMKANRQWATRPDDERFLSLTQLNDACIDMHRRSVSRVVSSRQLQCLPHPTDSRSLQLQGPNGNAVDLTHWSFGQLSARAEAPAGYLRTLPAAMAADCINYGLKHVREIESVGVLLTKNESTSVDLRAVTGPNYGRIYNATITNALVKQFGDGVSGRFRIPGEFGVQGQPITKENTTLYASDRDMFVFLADESHRLTVRNRREGKSGELSRGFFVWNSETGSSTFGISTFLFDYMCGNHIVWGAKQYKEIRIRHTAGAPDRYIQEVTPALLSYADSSVSSIEQGIAAAQKARIDNVDEFLLKRFSRSQVGSIKAAHVEDEQRPIETLWDASTGVTAYARNIKYMDERVSLEREAGKILDMAA